MPEQLTGAAPAKINLTLEVLGRRSDGYHELTSVMQKLDLADTITISFGDASGVSVTGPIADGTPADTTNLAWRAAAELAHRCHKSLDGLQIGIDKAIPAASGLGGGASDAATTLRLLARSWGIDDEPALLAAANAIGSDEAFFLNGPTALVTGRGETVRPLQPLPAHGVVLFLPGETLEGKTGRLFAELAGTPFDSGEATTQFVDRHPRAITNDDCENAFERVAFDVFPGLEALRNRLSHALDAPVRLAGAGPTLFWIGPMADRDAVARAAETTGATVLVTRTAG